MEIDFFGKKVVASAVITGVVSTLLFTLHSCGVTESDIWKLYYEIQNTLHLKFPKNNLIQREIERQINKKMITDPELLRYKVRRDLDRSIYEYEQWENKNRQINMKNRNILEEINKLKYTQLQRRIIENAVYYEFKDGTIGIRGEWVAPDSREIDLN